MGFGVGGQGTHKCAAVILGDQVYALPAGFGGSAAAFLQRLQEIPGQEGVVCRTQRVGHRIPYGFLNLREAGKCAKSDPGHGIWR